MKKIFIICVMVLLHYISIAQNKITGKITNQDDLPLIGVCIFVPDMNKGTVSDNHGLMNCRICRTARLKFNFRH